MEKKIAIIADDLTGANDTGVQFSKHGLDTIVMMETEMLAASGAERVVVIDTSSRGMAPEAARDKVAKVAAGIKAGQFSAVYKKVDSTLRGNLGIEIEAIMDTCKLQLAIVAPAFPRNGRVTIGGYHLMQSVPLEATEIARDPVCPVTESHLPTLLASQAKRNVGHIGIKTILGGPDSVFLELQELVAAGKTIIVFDVWQDAQFEVIVAAGVKLNTEVLWVGSAGLAECLPKILGMSPASKKEKPVAVFAGSVSNVTRSQVAVLKKRPDTEYVEIDTCELLKQETRDAELRRCLLAASTAAASTKDVVIVSGYNDAIVAATKSLGKELGLNDQQTSEIVAAAMGELCRQLVHEIPISGLVLTGGDIAVACCRSLGANGLKVIKEISSGIPLGVLKGGSCDGLPVVTKAGAFGVEDSLRKALECIKSL